MQKTWIFIKILFCCAILKVRTWCSNHLVCKIGLNKLARLISDHWPAAVLSILLYSIFISSVVFYVFSLLSLHVSLCDVPSRLWEPRLRAIAVMTAQWLIHHGGPSLVPSHGVHAVGRGGSFKDIELSRLSSAKPTKLLLTKVWFGLSRVSWTRSPRKHCVHSWLTHSWYICRAWWNTWG
jgi:hypothetical protein